MVLLTARPPRLRSTGTPRCLPRLLLTHKMPMVKRWDMCTWLPSPLLHTRTQSELCHGGSPAISWYVSILLPHSDPHTASATGRYSDSQCYYRGVRILLTRTITPALTSSTPNSLRAITRTLLATGTPSLATSFTAAARSRLRKTSAKRIATTNGLFATGPDGIHAVPTPELENILARARSLYGAGMGFSGLGLLSAVVKATVGLRWEQEGSIMVDILAVIDMDICQAIQVGFNI